jgi:hypothetical protein
MKGNQEKARFKTTVDELIVAVSGAASEFCEDQRGAYLLASLAFDEVLKKAHIRNAQIAAVCGELWPERTVLS